MSFDETFQKQLLERYDKRSRYFSQMFTATAVFALGFLAFVLVPLVGLQNEEARISEELRINAREQSAALAELKTLAATQDRAKAQYADMETTRLALEAQFNELESRSLDLTQRIEQAELALEKKTQELGLLKEQHGEFDRFRSLAESLPSLDVNEFVAGLQQFLRDASGALWGGGPVTGLGIGVDCPGGNQEARSDCIVRAKVMQMLSVHGDVVQRKLIAPIRAADAQLADNLEKQRQDVIANFNGILDRRPDFWQEVTLKHHVGQQFRAEIEKLSDAIDKSIATKLHTIGDQEQRNATARRELLAAGERLTRELGKLRSESENMGAEIALIAAKEEAAKAKAAEIEQEVATLKTAIEQTKEGVRRLSTRQAKIEADKTAISDRLKNVESPFGTLPIGLSEALQVSPIILAVGSIIVLLLLAELIQLRRCYHVALRQCYPDEQGRIDQGMAIITPLFLDPCRPMATNLWRGLVLAMLIVAYVAAVALITYSWALNEAPGELGRTIERGYTFLYLFFGMLLILPIVRLFREWQRYEGSTGAAA